MIFSEKRFCLDTNVLIQPWQKYYSPTLCPDYWEILDQLGAQGTLFIPQAVFDEIAKSDDDLSDWLKSSRIPVLKVDGRVTRQLERIYQSNEKHKFLVDNTKQRSLADPWVIAHALNENAMVVTKEEKVTAMNSNRIKIPNVCDNMGVPWMNDFQLIKELNIRFSCAIK
jgi:rRNA-processing protein FCF1